MDQEVKTQQSKFGRKRIFVLLAVAFIVAFVLFLFNKNTSLAPTANEPNLKTNTQNQEITLVIERVDGSISKRTVSRVPANTTAFDLFAIGDIEIEYDDYSFGKLVTSIDGVKQGGDDDKYWIFYVNGKLSQTGADSYILKPGDEIRWRYEENIYK